MHRRASLWLSIGILIGLGLTGSQAEARCLMCYDKVGGFPGLGTKYEVVPDSCHNYELNPLRNTTCEQLLVNSSGAEFFSSPNASLNAAAIVDDDFPSGGKVLVSRHGVGFFVRPTAGGNEYALLPNSKESSIIHVVRPGERAAYPPFPPIENDSGLVCPGGVDFGVVQTYIDPTTHEITNEVLHAVSISSLVFLPEGQTRVPLMAVPGAVLLSAALTGLAWRKLRRSRRRPAMEK